MKKVIIFLPLAKNSIDREFFESYTIAKTFLLQRVRDLPYGDIQLLEYFAHTFPIDANRNECGRRFLEGIGLKGGSVYKPDISIWIDTDHKLPPDTLFRLLMHDRPIMLGVYYIKSKDADQPFYPVLFRKREDRDDLFKAVMEYPVHQLFEVDFAGMGCACIHREIFEKLEYPYFKYLRHPAGSNSPESEWKNENDIQDVSEDRYFWDQVRAKVNHPILVDPEIQLGHIGRMIFDKTMYDSWLHQYKKVMIENLGEEKFNERWNVNAIAQPYKEIIRGSKKKLKKVS